MTNGQVAHLSQCSLDKGQHTILLLNIHEFGIIKANFDGHECLMLHAIKICKSSEMNRKKEDGSDRSVSKNQFSCSDPE